MTRGEALAALAIGALAAALGCAAPTGELAALPRGHLPFVWPRDGVVSLLTCRFETARPIGVFAQDASAEEATALARVQRALERGGLGVRFIDAPREHAQIHVVFAAGAAAGDRLGAHSVVDCKLAASANEAAAEIASARIEISRAVAAAPRTEPRPLARDELLGLLARELGRALGWSGDAPARDPVGARSLADARRVGAALREGAPLESPALRALYARPSGSVLASAPAEPALATRPVDRLARLAETLGLDGPYLRTGAEAGRVFWRDPASGAEYGAQIVEPARLIGAPGRVAVALERRARRSLPRSGDAPP